MRAAIVRAKPYFIKCIIVRRKGCQRYRFYWNVEISANHLAKTKFCRDINLQIKKEKLMHSSGQMEQENLL